MFDNPNIWSLYNSVVYFLFWLLFMKYCFIFCFVIFFSLWMHICCNSKNGNCLRLGLRVWLLFAYAKQDRQHLGLERGLLHQVQDRQLSLLSVSEHSVGFCFLISSFSVGITVFKMWKSLWWALSCLPALNPSSGPWCSRPVGYTQCPQGLVASVLCWLTFLDSCSCVAPDYHHNAL